MSIYRNTILLALLAGALLSKADAARADFVVKSAAPAVAASQPVSMAPIIDPQDLPSKPKPMPAWHWKVAKGFGNKVPLGFACRQIVPATVRVTFGPGATPAMLVSWKGGKGWNEVLREAVKPIGLRLVMTHMAVEVRK
jgi:hypothetical protein